MAVTIHNISWNSTYLVLEYTATDHESLCLYRVKSHRFAYFTDSWDGDRCTARLNVVLGQGREVLGAGEWIIARQIDESALVDIDTLRRKMPHLEARLERDAKRHMPKALRDDPDALEEKIVNDGLARIQRNPYDTHDIFYDEAVLQRIDNLDRVFRYGKNHYAYTGVFTPKTNSEGNIYLALDMLFYKKNSTPRRRSDSKRQKQKDLFVAFYRNMTKIIPRKGNRILFFKQNGDRPTENMAALHQRMLERHMDTEFDIQERYRNVFSGKQRILPWLGDLFSLARAKYIFIDDYAPIFNFIDPGSDAVLTQIWHAGVGFKSVGYARFGLKGSPDPYNSAHRRYTYALIGNAYLRTIYSEVFGIEEEALLATGMPRLDHFLDKDTATEDRKEMLELHPWADKGRVIVFAPTFRGTGQRTAYYPYDVFDMDRLYRMCEETNSYFVFEMHHFIKRRPTIPEEYSDRIFDLSDESLTKLFFIADVLVTDYSSCFYDFLLLKKPVVFFVPDKTSYSLIRGVQRTVDEMAPGAICNDFDEFMDVLGNYKYQAVEPHPSSIDRAIEHSGLASDRAIDTIIYDKDVPGVRAPRNAEEPADERNGQ